VVLDQVSYAIAFEIIGASPRQCTHTWDNRLKYTNRRLVLLATKSGTSDV
jgi:hypothetical protein